MVRKRRRKSKGLTNNNKKSFYDISEGFLLHHRTACMITIQYELATHVAPLSEIQNCFKLDIRYIR